MEMWIACLWRSENLGSQFCSSTMWAPDIEFRSLGLHTKCLYSLSHLSNPSSIILKRYKYWEMK